MTTITNELVLFAEQIQTFVPDVQQQINELFAESYCVEDMLNFIDQYDEDNFINHYEEYVRLGEQFDYQAVDDYLTDWTFDDLKQFEDRYQGEYYSFRDFAEEYFNEHHLPMIPEYLQSYIDYEQFSRDLEYDYYFSNFGYVFARH
jgi:antirestriction protein